MAAHLSNGTVTRRGPYRKRLYISSRLCYTCNRDYLYPGYGNAAGKCNDCLYRFGRRRIQ